MRKAVILIFASFIVESIEMCDSNMPAWSCLSRRGSEASNVGKRQQSFELFPGMRNQYNIPFDLYLDEIANPPIQDDPTYNWWKQESGRSDVARSRVDDVDQVFSLMTRVLGREQNPGQFSPGSYREILDGVNSAFIEGGTRFETPRVKSGDNLGETIRRLLSFCCQNEPEYTWNLFNKD